MRKRCRESHSTRDHHAGHAQPAGAELGDGHLCALSPGSWRRSQWPRGGNVAINPMYSIVHCFTPPAPTTSLRLWQCPPVSSSSGFQRLCIAVQPLVLPIVLHSLPFPGHCPAQHSAALRSNAQSCAAVRSTLSLVYKEGLQPPRNPQNRALLNPLNIAG